MNNQAPKPLTVANVLEALPGPPGDILMNLGYPDSAYNDKATTKALWGILEQLEAEGKIVGRPRTADDPWFSVKGK